MSRVTLEDIAREADVSTATVSRVLNNKSLVSPETRARVEAVIRDLDYQPIKRPQQDQRSRSCNVGLQLILLTHTLTSDWFFVKILEGVDQVLKEKGHNLVLSTVQRQDLSTGHATTFIEESNVDGLIIGGGPLGPEVVSELDNISVPVVLLDRYARGAISSAIIDNIAGASEAVRHLIALGHRQIGMVNGPSYVPACQDKCAGYRLALEEAGIPFCENLVSADERYHTWEGGYNAARVLLHSPERPTAILAFDDLMAYGVIRAAEEIGVHVPRDLAVVGFGDILYQHTGIPLTSVHIDYRYYGTLAARLLIDSIEQLISSSTQVSLRGSLVVRSTCGDLNPKAGDQ